MEFHFCIYTEIWPRGGRNMKHHSSALAFLRLRHSIRENEQARNTLLFAVEGVLFNTMTQLSTNNNYLFATRLGASPFQLSLVAMLPQLVSVCILIPAAILTDRMRNKRSMVMGAVSIVCLAYICIGFSPFFSAYRLPLFLGLLTLSAGPIAIYNSSWQSFFSDVVPPNRRNATLSVKNRCMFISGFLIPLLSGNLLASAAGNEEKIFLHQLLYWTASFLLLLQLFLLFHIRGGESPEQHAAFSAADLKDAFRQLAGNRRFLAFAGITIFFYISWQLDGTVFYLGQVKYLESDESWLAYGTALTIFMQFCTIGFWAKVNEKHGVRFGIIFGSFGLIFAPVALMIGTLLPHEIGRPVFVVSLACSNFAFATINLNILQCLLQVIGSKNKTLSIAIFNMGITLAMAVSPTIAVQIYTSLGSSLQALHMTFGLIICLRIGATLLWFFRWKALRREPK